MTLLDNIEQIRGNDPENMYNRIFDLPEQMQDALRIARAWKIDPSYFSDIENIVVVGMGGSAIGGDLARSYLAGKLMIPFHVCRNYELPEYVDDASLVIASSYSGNTEETLAAVDDALNRKAMIAAISTGGMLKDIARLNDIPMVIVPSGIQPRAALGYSFVPLMQFLEHVKVVTNVSKDIEQVIEALKSYRNEYIEDQATDINPAKKLASKLHGRIPIIYTGPSLTEAVGLRFKGQICENAKILAFANQFPEFNHNELVGWSTQIEPIKDQLIVVMLRDSGDHPQVVKRMDIVRQIIEETGVEVIDISSRGGTPLVRMFSLIQMGDFASYYLAALNKVDPTPVEAISKLKDALANG